ncbi:MAG: porphobilinogen synthase [Actinobacteria bacterium]|nr:porphobilinogen synthase [Actinomycetota bacterium]MSX10223.1 porphobilinogen synthase [Actinomycetota bacterium]MSX68456.1 porphobilinogen synthase [Actinomycetota bacterium]
MAWLRQSRRLSLVSGELRRLRTVDDLVRRPRRLRRTPAIRRLVSETRLSTADVVAPLFVAEAATSPQAITSLPGHFQHTLDSLTEEVARLLRHGVSSVMLFGVPSEKDSQGTGASDPQGIVQVALERLNREFHDDVVIFADLCLDEYTDHGHCGVLDSEGKVDNDATLLRYQAAAIAQADAGVDFVAPSGMMDGQVGAIRSALDTHGRHDVGILAYSAKYVSGLYGPFREAVSVEIADGGDRRGYQQDFSNRREALLEVQLDIEQGADIVMVKPAVTYLDVIADVAGSVDVPVAAYHVSGEYSMIKAAGEKGWIDADAVALEQLTAVKRAGADIIVTYFAGELDQVLDG